MASKAKSGGTATRARPKGNKAPTSTPVLQWYRGPKGNVFTLLPEMARLLVGLTPIAPPSIAEQRRRRNLAPPLDPEDLKAVKVLDRAMEDVLRACGQLDRLRIPPKLARALMLQRADLHWTHVVKPPPLKKRLEDPEHRRVKGSSNEAMASRSAISRDRNALIKASADEAAKQFYRLMIEALSHATTKPPTTPTKNAPEPNAPGTGTAGGFLQSLIGRATP